MRRFNMVFERNQFFIMDSTFCLKSFPADDLGTERAAIYLVLLRNLQELPGFPSEHEFIVACNSGKDPLAVALVACGISSRD